MTVSPTQAPSPGTIGGMAMGGFVLGFVAHPIFFAFFAIGFSVLLFGALRSLFR